MSIRSFLLTLAIFCGGATVSIVSKYIEKYIATL